MNGMTHIGDDDQVFAGRREGAQVVDLRHQSDIVLVSTPEFSGHRERLLDLLDDLIGRTVSGCWIRGGVRRDRARPTGVLIARGITDTGPPFTPAPTAAPPRRSPAGPRQRLSA